MLKFFLIILSGFLVLIPPVYAEPYIKDDELTIQKYVSGICCSPTTMAFIGNDILILEKSSGEVHLIKNGILFENPVLKENVTSDGEQGMLGIDIVGKKVYLYFTESSYNGGLPLGKRVYSYDWDGNMLVNKTLVKDMPQTQSYHNGGVMTTDLNGSVYLVVGDAGRYGILENHPVGTTDDTGVILRLVPPGPYYAIGIRNSFGLAVDPVTGNLWDTENGPDYGDEINIVPPNFNSGWDVLMGPANATQLAKIPHYKNYVYHDPQFTWWKSVAPTAISFVSSDKFPKYHSSVLGGDCNNGNLYKFELNQNRDGFVFQSDQLKDNVVNIGDSMDEIILGTGFGCITDIKQGPDGLIYIVSLSDGTIYRLIPKQLVSDNQLFGLENVQYLIYTSVGVGVALIMLFVRKSRKKEIAKDRQLESGNVV